MNFRLVFATLLVSIPTTAWAQNVQHEVATGRVYEIETLAEADNIYAIAENARSYCCEISHIGQNNIQPRFETVTASAGTILNIAERGRNAPWVAAGNNLPKSRQCFRFQHADSVSRTFLTLDVGAKTFPIPNARILCQDTTLFGGFNTVVTDFNFIELTNTLASTDIDATVTINIVARGTAGTELLNSTITLEAGKRQDVDIHSVAANDFGPVVITHNGPSGSIKAVNSQYRIVTQSPLDFEPVLSVPFQER